MAPGKQIGQKMNYKGDFTMAIAFLKENLNSTESFDKLQNKAAAIAADRTDHIINVSGGGLTVNDDCTLSFTTITPYGIEDRNLPMTDWAQSQFFDTRLGIPYRYAKKCIEAGRTAELAEHANMWLSEQKPGKRQKSVSYLLRQYQDKIDAVVTKNYTCFDSTAILNTIENTLNIPDWQNVGSYISDERLHIRLIQDKMLNVDGEDLFPGICIDSSDVGRASFNVTFFIWKRVCTNGMCISKVGGQLYHQRHMGITPIEVRRELASNLGMIPTLIQRSEDIIKASRKKTVDIKDEQAFQRLLTDIRRQAVMSEEEAKAVVQLAQEKYDMSLWGIGNAMTLKAQEYELDRRIVIENAAGKIIA